MTTSTCELLQPETMAPTPEDLSTMVQAGSAALQDGDLRSALETFERVIAAFPDQPEGHNNLGALYSSLGEFAKAEESFDRVLKILPRNANILYNRGVVRSRQEKFEEARTDFEAALQTSPADADILNNLGVISFAQGQLKQARKHFRKAGKIDPTNTNVIMNLCDIEVAENRIPAAIELCEKYLKNQTDSNVHCRLLDLLSQQCRQALDRASSEAELLLQYEPANQQARLELGRFIQAKTALAAEAG